MIKHAQKFWKEEFLENRILTASLNREAGKTTQALGNGSFGNEGCSSSFNIALSRFPAEAFSFYR